MDAPVRRAALWVPDWPVVAAMAAASLDADAPAAVLHGRGLVAVSAAARAAGVRRGMRRRQAQSRCPELAILPHDDGRDARAFEDVALGAEEVVSGVEVTRPGLLMIPATGAARFFGGEEALAEALVVAATERSGAEVSVGIADGLLAAVEAARGSVIVPAGGSAAYLAPLPVASLAHVATERRHLSAVEDMVGVLERLGIDTLGALAALPRADVIARFGSAGAWAHRLAGGGDLAPPVLRRIEQDIEVRSEFEEAPRDVERIALEARRAAEALDAALRDAGVRCLRVSVAVVTERGEELERTWRTDVGPRRGRLRALHGRPRPLAARGLAQPHLRGAGGVPSGVPHPHRPRRRGRGSGAGVPLGRGIRGRRAGPPGDGAYPGPDGGGGGADRRGAGRPRPPGPGLLRPLGSGRPARAPRRPPVARPSPRPRSRPRSSPRPSRCASSTRAAATSSSRNALA